MILRVDRLIDNGKINKLKSYLQDLLDRGMTGTPDQLVKRAIRMMISAKKSKRQSGSNSRWADDHDEDDNGD